MTVTRGFTEEADKLLDYLVSFQGFCHNSITHAGLGQWNIRRSLETVFAQLDLCNIPCEWPVYRRWKLQCDAYNLG